MGKIQKLLLSANIVAGSILIGMFSFPFLFSLMVHGHFGNLAVAFLIVLLAVVNFFACMRAIHKGEKRNAEVRNS